MTRTKRPTRLGTLNEKIAKKNEAMEKLAEALVLYSERKPKNLTAVITTDELGAKTLSLVRGDREKLFEMAGGNSNQPGSPSLLQRLTDYAEVILTDIAVLDSVDQDLDHAVGAACKVLAEVSPARNF